MTLDLEKMTVQELTSLARRVQERLRYLYDIETRQTMAQYTSGDLVTFLDRGRYVEGVITKVNQKTVSLRTVEGEAFRISPSFLKKATSPSKVARRLKEEYFNPLKFLLERAPKDHS